MLRKIRKKDIDYLHEKLNNLSDKDRKLYHPHPFTKEALTELLTKDYDYYFVLEKNGKIVGYSMLRTFNKYEIPTYGQVLWEKHRGKGYGSEILIETLKEAEKIGFNSVKLKVYPHNKVAYNLYIKHGFKEIGTEGKEIWMEKKLDIDHKGKEIFKKMKKEIKIENKIIGENHPVFIIAEAGVNHNGDINMAKKLIDAAVEAKADAVKFQSFKAEKLNTKNAPKANYHIETTGEKGSWFDLLKSQELSKRDHEIIKNYCNEKKIIFLSTPYDEESADLLDKLGVHAFKIASTDLTNLPLLEHIAKKKKPIILSTGLSNYSEIKEAIDTIKNEGNNDIIVLQCTADYPAEIEDANLSVMNYIKKKFDVLVGYSDHTLNDILPIASTIQGSCLYEKHFTLDRSLPGPDHRTSAEPEELKQIIKKIRLSETVMGNIRNKPAKSEIKNINRLRKSVVAAINIKEGEVFTRDKLLIKRPGTGLHPRNLKKLLNKKAKRDIKKDELLNFEMVE